MKIDIEKLIQRNEEMLYEIRRISCKRILGPLGILRTTEKMIRMAIDHEKILLALAMAAKGENHGLGGDQADGRHQPDDDGGDI